MHSAIKRPTSVTVIAWIFIVGAVFMFLSSSMVLIVFSAMQQMGGMPSMPETAPETLRMIGTVFQHIGQLALLQAALSAFILFTAIQFLRLRAWAREALEVISWLALVYTAGFGIFWMYAWITATSNIPPEGLPSGFEGAFTTFGVAIGAVVLLVSAIPIIIIICFLRGSTIKRAVTLQ